jgi:NADH-quinone oxidoreductase subunit M
MNLLCLPWLELSIGLAVAGALAVGLVRDPIRAARGGLVFTGTIFVCTTLAWLSDYLGIPADATDPYSMQLHLMGRKLLQLDGLSAPLVPAVALLHFFTGLATPRTKTRRFSFTWSLAAEAIRLATFACREIDLLVALLMVSSVPPYVELVNRKRPTRVYVAHMGLFLGLLLLGWAMLTQGGDLAGWAFLPLAGAMLVRCGTIPVHCWVTDWFENASFGNALLFATPLVGFYVAVRLVLPIAPDWALQTIGIISLLTAIYAAGMATVQREPRRLFAYLFISHASLVLVGLELHTSITLTGALCLWFSLMLSLGGFGLTLRALEARFARLSLDDYQGLYEHVPTLAVCFLVTGLATVGFPGTLGFVSTELLVDGALNANPSVGLVVAATAALNGIAIVRAYFRIFTGKRHLSTVLLHSTVRERIAVLTLSTLILLGGWFPQPGVTSRHQAAEEVLRERQREIGDTDMLTLEGSEKLAGG